MDRPYFFTWSEQKNPKHLSIKKITDHEIILEDNKELADLLSISFQCSFGHQPEKITSPIKEQIDLFSVMPPNAVYPHKDNITKKLINLLNLNGGKIFYTVSGAESIENAAKIARTYTGRKLIACKKASYHGASFGALSLTGDWRNEESDTFDDWTVRIPEPQDDPQLVETKKVLEKVGANNIAAFCLETVSGINGVIDPPLIWWQEIQKFCDQNKILLIVDEVICGFYRTGTAFGFQNKAMRPDIVCMAKAITGGVIPFGAVWTSSKVAEFYNHKKLVAGLTNYAHPLGLAALNSVINIISDKTFQQGLQNNIATLKNFLTKCNQLTIVSETRQAGLLAAVVFDSKVKLNWDDFVAAGYYLALNNAHSIILAPALNYPADKLTNILDSLYTFIKELSYE